MSDYNCTQNDLDQGIVCLTRGQSIGLAGDAWAGLISLAAVVGALTVISVSHDTCNYLDRIN